MEGGGLFFQTTREHALGLELPIDKLQANLNSIANYYTDR